MCQIRNLHFVIDLYTCTPIVFVDSYTLIPTIIQFLYFFPFTVSERTRVHFEEAMSEGTLWIRNGNTFFLGPGGSGKTHTLAALLEEDPPPTRESTACAKTPVRAIAQLKMEVSGSTHFVRISEDHYSEMLAKSAEEICIAPSPKKMKLSNDVRSHELSTAAPTLPQKSSESIPATASTGGSSIDRQQPVAKPGLKKELLCRMQAKSKVSGRLNKKDLVNNRDSGGQPMFHEVLPVFVTNTSFGILCVKLNECLDDHPMVEYFIGGKRIGKPFKSPFTHLQTFRHCVKFLQSNSDESACPKLVFVGTHVDLEHECKGEDRKAKNEKLLSIVPPEMRDRIIFNGTSLKELLFPINAKRPGEADRKIMADIRALMIQELQKLPRQKVPLRYFSLEMMFQRLVKHKRKAVLSVEECFEEASTYCFTKESFIDALRYLHNLKLILYYEDILPGVVFINSQVLLDKITELVEYSIQLESDDDNKDPTTGSLRMFKACGIITTEILSRFRSGYVPGLFMEEELRKVFLKLFIIAEIGKGKYLMACLLREEVILASSDRSAHQVVPDMLYYFGPDGAKLGVYCFLISSLINEAKWELLTEGGCQVKLSRNRARFTVPGKYPGFVTITDSFSTFFSVKIEFPEKVTAEEATDICKKVCPTIRETILGNIQVAYRKLNYNDSSPQVAFLCSDHEGTSPHPAIVSEDTGFLTCTTHPGSVCCQMTSDHKVWLGKPTVSTSKPLLPVELTIKDLRMVLRAAWDGRSKWYNIGLELEIDPGTLKVIEGNNYKNIDDCFRDMLTTWLNTVEPKPTSAALADALRSPTVGYVDLAGDL